MLIEIDSNAVNTEVKDIFSIDGRWYTMPVEVSASVALQMLHIARTEGQEAAISWTMEEVLGTEAYDALRNCRALKSHQLQSIIKVVTETVMGAMEEEGKG
jgi:myo-inositol catabolism protein IolC